MENNKLVMYRTIEVNEDAQCHKQQILSTNCIAKEYHEDDKKFNKNELLEIYKQKIHPDMEKRVQDFAGRNYAFAFKNLLDAHYFAYTKRCSSYLIVKFETTLDNLAIDGRDGISGLFQYGKLKIFGNDDYMNKLVTVYGLKIVNYLFNALSSYNMEYKLSLLDEFCLGNETILHHYHNELTVKGRYDTRFKSAFLVIDAKKVNLVGIDEYKYYQDLDYMDNDYFDILSYRSL